MPIGKKDYPHQKLNYYSAAFIAISTCSMLAFFNTQNIDINKFSWFIALSCGSLGLKQAVFNHYYSSSVLGLDVLCFTTTGVSPAFIFNTLIPIGATLIPKFLYCHALAVLNCPKNNESPSIIDISTRVISVLLSIKATSLHSDAFFMPCIGAMAMLNIVAPCLEHFVEENKHYSKIVKASIATCAVAALVYSVDGGKIISGLNISSLFSKGAAIEA